MRNATKAVATVNGGGSIEYIDHPNIRRAARRKVLLDAARRLLKHGTLISPADEAQLFQSLHACGREIHVIRGGGAANEIRAKELVALRGRILDCLVDRNMGLIFEMRRRSRVANVDPDELLSEGLWTLFRAVASFDPWRGFRFSTYACTSILRGFAVLARRKRREVDRLYRVHEFSGDDISWEPPRSSDHDLLIERLEESLLENRGALTPIERLVIERRLLNPPTHRPETLSSLGRMLRLSKERVRQIQLSALGKLKSSLSRSTSSVDALGRDRAALVAAGRDDAADPAAEVDVVAAGSFAAA